jgi:hypothetical protein
MTRTAADIATNPNATGDCNWHDRADNWRDADAIWLQERSIVRVETTPDVDTNLANTNEGRVFYSTGNQVLYLSTTGGWPFQTVLASEMVAIDESVAGTASVGIAGFMSSGVSFDTATGHVTIGNLTITTLSGPATMSVTDLTADTLTANTSLGVGTVMITAPGGTLTIDSPVEIDADFACPYDTTLASLLVTADTTVLTLAVGDTVTVATSVTTPLVQAHAAEDLTVHVQSGKSMLFTAPTVGDANFFYGTSSGPRLGWVVVNASDPGVANVPEGTLWIQPD